MSDQKSNSAIIRHVVFFSAKDPRDIDQIVDGLSMLSAIPSVKHFEVSRNRNEDRFANDVDVIVYAEFEDDAQLALLLYSYQSCKSKFISFQNSHIAMIFLMR